MASSPPSRSRKNTREMEESGLSPPNKRPRQDLIPVISSQSSKGKAKIGEDVEYDPDQALHRCGICLSEEGTAVRGCIDICDHYFCFVCIMEWSKIESRCPMCKRRFDTIRRFAKLGVYASERVVKIPVRDQVFNGLENSSVCPLTLTPYSEVGCSVCKSEEDEKLLLLCDLCDTAAHTYCVGLDAIIPEGDWYCNDCSIAMDEHSNSEMNTDSDCLGSSIQLPQLPQAEVHVSVVDIVHETVLGVARHSSTMSSSPVDSNRNNLDVNNGDQGSRRTPTISSVSTNLGGDRSLRRCRNIHGRLQALRENWNAYRIGTFGFPSRTTSNNGYKNERREFRANSYMGKSCASLMASSSASGRIPCNVSSSNAVSSGNSPDIRKAWAMLDAAKLIGQPHSKMGLIPQLSRCPSGNNGRSLTKVAVVHGNPIKLDKDTKYQNQCMYNLQEKSNNDRYKRKVSIEQNPGHNSTKMSSRFCERSQGPEISRDCRMLSSKSIHYHDKANGGQQHFEGSSKQKAHSSSCTPIKYVQSACLNFPQRPMPRPSNSYVLPDSTIEISKSSVLPNSRIEPSNSSYSRIEYSKTSSRFCERSQGPEIPRDSTMLSAKSIHYRDKANGGQKHFEGSSKQKAPSSSCTPIKYVQSACLNFPQRPMPRPSNSSVLPNSRIEPSNSSALPYSRIEPSNSSVLPDSRIEHSNTKLGVDDGPKAEIRSLVKLNLKLLSKGRDLGVDVFKEIARRSTHSILAACGLEPPRPGMSSFLTGSVCNHKDQLRKSTLMPNCCRECFYVFVKDVVNSTMSERMNI